MLKISQLALFLCLSCLCYAQSAYEKGWQALNNAKLPEAKEHFQKCIKGKNNVPEALLVLSILEGYARNEEQASNYAMRYLELAEKPSAAVYALWEHAGFTGGDGDKSERHLALMDQLQKLENYSQYFKATDIYTRSADLLFAQKIKESFEMAAKLNALNSWSFVGPFDNVMNSGYNKDFGPLSKSSPADQFKSQYGAMVSWFQPAKYSQDAYVFKDMYFNSNNSLVYAQTFVELEEGKDIILKFGYSGSLKVWINDSCIYNFSEHRVTEIDYFQEQVSLPKGTNRILVQLGEFKEDNPNFTMRITDVAHNNLAFKAKPFAGSYNKELLGHKTLKHFAIPALEANKNKPLYAYLLAEAYKRSNETDSSTAIISRLLKKYPNNYLFQRFNILNYEAAGDGTNQNLAYEVFAKTYPNDFDILKNEFDELIEQSNKDKAEELYYKIKGMYVLDEFDPLMRLDLHKLDENINALLAIVDSMYVDYPKSTTAISNKYSLLKGYYSNQEAANDVLASYLKNNYNHYFMVELANNLMEQGKFEQARKWLEANIEAVPYSYESYDKLIQSYLKREEYDKAIALAKEVLRQIPSSTSFMETLAVLYDLKQEPDSAIHYYSESLRYFPFSFETNEKVNKLKGGAVSTDLISSIDEDEIIADFEANAKIQIKKSYDIVYDRKDIVLYQSSALGTFRTYILRVNDEEGIEDLQNLNLSSGNLMQMYAREFKTIKKDGSKLNAERYQGDVVFTNLEIGDYVLASYYEKQFSGGKSSVFYSNEFGMDSYRPIYHREYNVYVQDGYPLKTKVTNGDIAYEKTRVRDFTKHQWKMVNPDPLKDESGTPPYADIARKIHIGADQSWSDIVAWYSDLSSEQARSNLTIKSLAEQLYDPNLSEQELHKKIYEFVVSTIRYSSVDFRQGSFIPGRASDIYHARLGDCKDVSVLYVAIAREMGLEANMVLINTADNGEKAVVLPSLDFNHCIVKTYPKGSEPLYLELTDKNLPFGELYTYHYGSAILEIPKSYQAGKEYKIEKLGFNPGFENGAITKSSVALTPDLRLMIDRNCTRKGSRAAGFVDSYYYKDPEEQKEGLQSRESGYFKSLLSIKDFDFSSVKPRSSEVAYKYSFEVENDILKLGSYYALKIPFVDVLTSLNIFKEGERKYPFNFRKWENTDYYEEEIDVDFKGFYLLELPKNVEMSFNGNTYNLSFEKVSDHVVKVKRQYRTNREYLAPEKFQEFKRFIVAMHEAENTYLVLKNM